MSNIHPPVQPTNSRKKFRVAIGEIGKFKPAKKQKVELSVTGWIGALDAAQLLAAYDGDLGSAKSLLVESMQEGVLTARANCWCQEADVGEVKWHQIEWSGFTPSREHKGQIDQTVFSEPAGDEAHVDLPRDLFLKSNSWTTAAEDIRWEEGYFIAKRPAELLLSAGGIPSAEKMIRRFAVCLQFHVKEVGAMATARIAQRVASESGSNAPRKGRPFHENWPKWVSELFVLQQKGSIKETTKSSHILRWIDVRMTLDGYDVPHRSNTHPVASAVIKTLKDLAGRKSKKAGV